MNDFYTIEEVACLCNKSQKTIRRHIAAKKLKATRIQNKWRIYKNDYEDWLIDGENQETEDNFSGDPLFSKNTYVDEVKWIDIKDKWGEDGWKNVDYRNGYNFIDLFSGAGGLSCGLAMAGFTPIASVEIMQQAVMTYEYNFIKQKKFDEAIETSDIREENVKKELYKKIEGKHIHLIVGGFPCQGFSLSGNRVVTDDRNSLYKEMLKIVEQIKPEYVVMENVEGLRSMLNGKIEQQIIKDYHEIGYEINVTVLNSADYGVAQTRRRVIFIGNRIKKNNYHPKPFLKENEYKTLGQEIERFLNLPEDKAINHIFTNHSPKMVEKISNVPEGSSLYGDYSDAWKKSPWDKPSCTIKENHGGVNIHPKLPRVLTPRELAALQSFPDDFIFKGPKKWQLVQIGNAVPPLLGKAIGIAVMKGIDQIKNEEK